MISTKKNLIFTITCGRTGTTFLKRIFEIFDNTCALHEPEPNYARALPFIKKSPEKAIPFLQEKIAFINSIQEINYVETSHVFGKGFFIPLLRMGIKPGLIFLNRNFRKVASSFYERGSIPMRTDRGIHYSADPRAPGSLPIYSPESLTDYQLCYWSVLDAYARQIQAEHIYKKEGGKFFWALSSDFHNFNKVIEIGRLFNLNISNKSLAKNKHLEIISKHHNPNISKVRNPELISFIEEESDVLNRVAFYDPLFVEKAISSPFIEPDIKNMFCSK